MQEKFCSKCGMSFSDILDCGVVGCAHCYEEFAEQLSSIIYNVQKPQNKLENNKKSPSISKDYQAFITDLEFFDKSEGGENG